MPHFQDILDKVVPWNEASMLVREWNEAGQKVVFTNGCFDLIHAGHIQYLAQAADLGERMIIGLNTDASVQALKGSQRPINDEYARALLLSTFEFVDLVVLFGEETPYELIHTLQPDYLVKGSDYQIEDIAGYDVVLAKGGEVITIDLVEGYSSTGLIEKIKNLA